MRTRQDQTASQHRRAPVRRVPFSFETGRRDACRTWSLCFIFLIACFTMPASAQSAPNKFWQAQSIYQIITDRFYDGDTNNDNAEGTYAPSGNGGSSVHGGDFEGIEQKLDYIKALGATAIWISPIVLNTEGQFHGYSGWNFYEVAPHWGSISNLQHMVQAAHARGLLVIDDIVVNHGGDLVSSSGSTFNYPAGYTLSYANGNKTYPAPFNLTAANPSLTNLFHNYGSIQNFNDSNQVVLGWLDGLNDFRTETSYVRSNMAAIYEYWIQQIGFDGYRVDTALEVDMGCWQTFCPAIHAYAATNGDTNFFMFGEADNGSEAVVAPYTGMADGGPFEFDSVVDYPLYDNAIQSVFASASGATSLIQNHYNSVDSIYDPASRMQLVTFLDNHDNPRFLSTNEANNNTNRLEVALAFLYTSRGIPCLYYGTEQAFDGTTDPNDREDMFAGRFKDGPSGTVQQLSSPGPDNFNMTHPLFLWVAQLNNFRRLYPALTLGSYVNRASNSSGPGLFAYSRIMNTQEVFTVFNTAGSSQTLPATTLTYPEGTVLLNLLNTNESYTLTAGSQTPPISVPSTTAKIFIAQSQWQPLDPVVISNSPAHWATNAPTWSPIALQFSKPMDTNSVQNALYITPATSGTFSWSPANDMLTFTPGGAGLAGSTNYVVRLTNSAVDAISGKSLFAPYELKFHTAAFSVHDVTPPYISLQTPTNGATISGNLTISGIATDNVAVAKAEVQLDNDAWQTASGTTSWNASLNSSNFLNGPHQLSARATDTSGNISATNTISIWFFNVPGNYLQRVSGGNPVNVTDCSGNVWLKDTPYSFGSFGYSGGTTGVVANTISGICASAQTLYQRERYSTSSSGFYYEFDCPEGIYQITLLEAETYWNGPGKREFNVFIQGKQVLTNFDIYATAGGANIPISLVFTNAVTNSQLQILFTPGAADNARVSGAQVQKIADVFSDTDGIPDWWRLAWFGHPLGEAADKSRGSDDADGNGISNLTKYLTRTDPLNPADYPTPPICNITQISASPTNVQINCLAGTNWTFQLQGRATLDASSSWTNIGPSQPGTGAINLFNDLNPATNSARYYRVHAR
ncbi:MAG TPA: alpha-amylase family glycosyl hydrolase [Verrucomicrobiae bacterium]|nr:alpha-amylase family glycosyl hydrolase [Verrucomicrobiae bacterium]